jgi:hypothetical protein
LVAEKEILERDLTPGPERDKDAAEQQEEERKHPAG